MLCAEYYAHYVLSIYSIYRITYKVTKYYLNLFFNQNEISYLELLA